jgi:hypothetical protein
MASMLRVPEAPPPRISGRLDRLPVMRRILAWGPVPERKAGICYPPKNKIASVSNLGHALELRRIQHKDIKMDDH